MPYTHPTNVVGALHKLQGQRVNVVPTTTLPYKGTLKQVCEGYVVIDSDGGEVTVATQYIVAFWRLR